MELVDLDRTQQEDAVRQMGDDELSKLKVVHGAFALMSPQGSPARRVSRLIEAEIERRSAAAAPRPRGMDAIRAALRTGDSAPSV